MVQSLGDAILLMAKQTNLSAAGAVLANGFHRGGQAGHFKRVVAYPGIGAGNVSFLPGVTLPLFDFRGPGVVPTFDWMITQPPQVWQGLNVPTIGLPGVLSGQFTMQRLIDMRGKTSVQPV